MCSKMLGTSLNKFQHKRKIKSSPPLPPPPHGENDPQKKKKGLPHREKAPVRRKKVPYMIFFQGGRSSASACPPPPGSPRSKSDNKMNNIFGNYSAHNCIKIHSRMHPVALFHKKISW